MATYKRDYLMNCIARQFEEHRLFRRLMMTWSMVLMTYVIIKTMDYVFVSTLPGVELAAVVAAMLAPNGILQGFLSKLYADGKKP